MHKLLLICSIYYCSLLVAAAPGPLRNVSLNYSEQVYTVQWTPPSYPAGLYGNVTLTYSASCNGKLMTVSHSTTNQQISLSALKPGLHYRITVSAVNIFGNGQETTLSNISLDGQGNFIRLNVTVTVTCCLQTVPLSSPWLMVKPINSTALLATWQLVDCFDSSGESPGYILRIEEELNGAFMYLMTVQVEPFTENYTFTGLDGETYYMITINAKNGYGEGLQAGVMTILTPDENTTSMPPSNATATNSTEPELPVTTIIIGSAVGGGLILFMACFVPIMTIAYACCIR